MQSTGTNTESNMSEICIVCSDNDTVKPHEGWFCTNCGVKFCKCVITWAVANNNSCPTCREDDALIKMRDKTKKRLTDVQFNRLKIIELFELISDYSVRRTQHAKMVSYKAQSFIISRIDEWTKEKHKKAIHWIFDTLLEPVLFERCLADHDEPGDESSCDKVMAFTALGALRPSEMIAVINKLKELKLPQEDF
jgi:hypothetical protein